jgi:hypothetical protein
MSLFPKAPFA